MYVNDYYENKKGNKILFIITIAILFILGVIFLVIRILSKNLKEQKKGEVETKVEKQDVDKKTEDKSSEDKKQLSEDKKTNEEVKKDESDEQENLKDESTEEKKEKITTKSTVKTTTKKTTKKVVKKNNPTRQNGVYAIVKTKKYK